MVRYAHITGWGIAVPERVLSNEDLTEMVDTSDEWIQARTGILTRRIAAKEDTTATMGADACCTALTVANVKPPDVDLIIVATSSPEHIFPATACLIQDQIGAVNAGAFDLSAACTGFIYAINMAAQAIRTGAMDTVLVVGSETLSRFVDWSDRGTCILFGDGAGAFVLQGSDEPGGVLSAVMRSDGSGGDLLSLPAGGSKHPASSHTVSNGMHYIHMNGREVFRFATRVMASATETVIEEAGITLDDVDIIIPHQANRRILEAAARGLKVPMDRIAMNVDKFGNTSTASIPLATYEAIQDGRLHKDDHVVFVGFGAGLTWGALAIQWTGPFPTKKPIPMSRYRLLARIRSFLRRVWRRLEGLIWGRR